MEFPRKRMDIQYSIDNDGDVLLRSKDDPNNIFVLLAEEVAELYKKVSDDEEEWHGFQ